jgi:hypothetical protein
VTAWRPPSELPSGTFRIDPTARWSAVAAGVVLPLLMVAIVARSPADDRVGAVLVLAPMAVLFVLTAIGCLVLRIDHDGETLTKRGLFTSRSLRVDEITTVAYVQNPRRGLTSIEVVLYADRVGSRIVIDTRYWDRTLELMQLARALDPRHRPDPVTERLDAEARRRLG